MKGINLNEFQWFRPEKKEFKTERINVRLTPETKEQLELLAAKADMAISSYIELLIKKDIIDHKANEQE